MRHWNEEHVLKCLQFICLIYRQNQNREITQNTTREKPAALDGTDLKLMSSKTPEYIFCNTLPACYILYTDKICNLLDKYYSHTYFSYSISKIITDCRKYWLISPVVILKAQYEISVWYTLKLYWQSCEILQRVNLSCEWDKERVNIRPLFWVITGC